VTCDEYQEFVPMIAPSVAPPVARAHSLRQQRSTTSGNGVLIVGNFLSGVSSTRGVCEDLSLKLESIGWNVLRTSSKRGRLQRLTDMLSTVWFHRREYGVASVEVYSGLAFFWAEAVCCALRWANKPYILTLHGGNLPVFARRWPGRVRRLLRSAAAVTAPSSYLHEQMRTYRRDLRLVPNPLELRHYPFTLREQPTPKLVWLRAFHSIYNPTLAPRVLALLSREFPAATLLMVGPDKGDGSTARVHETAMQLGIADRLTIVPGVPKAEVPVAMNRGDIFLNTTNIDNTPVSVLEAMACGLCVVSTNVGGIPYLLGHEKDSLLVDPGQEQAMADAVRRVLRDPRLAGSLSRAARAKTESLDWASILPQWDEMLSHLARGREHQMIEGSR
jgi:glycosyltransferase involved in cell wall biosynthesis